MVISDHEASLCSAPLVHQDASSFRKAQLPPRVAVAAFISASALVTSLFFVGGLGKPWGRGRVHGRIEASEVAVLQAAPVTGIGSLLPGTLQQTSLPRRRNSTSPSLYCFTVMRPATSEHDLLNTQYDMRAGIFACEGHDVFSSKEVPIGSSLSTPIRTTKVESDLKCEVGGDFETALNTDIFLIVWAAVSDKGAWHLHDWTVKADPDTAFFPDRLRMKLRGIPDAPEGAYLENCRYGMHGPLEAFNRRATGALLDHKQYCLDTLQRACNGACPFGEDMFVDRCLGDVVGVRRIEAYHVVDESHCDGQAWMLCDDPTKAAFHPCKTVEALQTCLRNAAEAMAAFLQPGGPT